MKRLVFGLLVLTAIAPAFAETYYTVEELGGKMAPEQEASLTSEQLQLRLSLIDLKITKAKVALRAATCNLRKGMFEKQDPPDDPSC